MTLLWPIFGRSAEFAHHHHERLVQQAVHFEIVEKRRDALVERRKQPGAKLLAVVGVGIPVVHVAHVGLDDRHAGLDQPARQQERLAEHVPAVAIAQARIFAVELERPLDAARGQHRERLVLNTREGPADSHVSRHRRPGGRSPRATPRRLPTFSAVKPDGKRQLIDPKARVVRVGLDVPGIELRTEHAGVLAGKAVAVVQVGRQMNAVRHTVGPRIRRSRGPTRSTASRPETPCDVEPGGKTLMPVSIMWVACS